MLVLALILVAFQVALVCGYTGNDYLPALVDGIVTIGWLAAIAYLAWFVVGLVSLFQTDVIMIIVGSLLWLAGSFMVSADNAHALHPNYADKTDPVNHPVLNKGIVIKYNANQKYCTDAVSAAEFTELCIKAGVPYQTFVNRSDIAGGSTLGNISNTQVAMNTVDIGLPQLAMHSPYETAGVKDTEYLIRVAGELFA